MSILVHYKLKDAADYDHQVKAMQTLVADLKSEGISGLDYSCFSTGEATEFIGVLEFDGDAAFKAFQASAAFESYKTKVGPTFANPPQTQAINAIASTRA